MTRKSSSIFNANRGLADGDLPADQGDSHQARRAATRRFFPGALAVAAAVGAILEYTVFRHADMLADRSTVAIAYKGKRLEQGRSEQVVILGPSTALAIDARRLQQSTQDRVSIYNYALPNLGTAERSYFVLKKYLQFNRRPDLVLLALPPDSILNESAEQSEAFIEEIERQRFRRFFGPMFLLTEVAPATGRWSFVTQAAFTMLPSVNYRVFIKNATFAPEQDEMSDWEPVDSVRSLYRRNRRIIARLEATNGQLIYYSDRVVAASQIARSMPAQPDVKSKMAPFIEKAIALADSSGIRMTMLFTPMCCDRDRGLAQNGTWELLLKLVQAYEAQYAKFRFVDGNAGPYERENFGDAIHLNELGAERFNTELVARLPEILAPKVASTDRPTPAHR